MNNTVLYIYLIKLTCKDDTCTCLEKVQNARQQITDWKGAVQYNVMLDLASSSVYVCNMWSGEEALPFDYWPLVQCVSSRFWNRRNYIVLGEGQGAGEKAHKVSVCVLASRLFWMIEMHGVNLAVSITRQGCNLLLQYSIPEYLFTKLPIMNISDYYSNYVL